MQMIHLGSQMLGVLASSQELAAEGIFLHEPEAEALIHFAKRLCGRCGLRASRAEEIELHAWPGFGSVLCMLSPPKTECFSFDSLPLALDALEQLPTLRRCALLRSAAGYVVATEQGAQASRLSEFGAPLSEKECLALGEGGLHLAGEQELRRLLRPRRRPWY